MLIDPEDPELHQIFFDDNIFYNQSNSIVDVRNKNGTVIPHHQAKDKYIVKVDTYKAIFNPNYFIEKVF